MPFYYDPKDLVPLRLGQPRLGVTGHYYRLPCSCLWRYEEPHPDCPGQTIEKEAIVDEVEVTIVKLKGAPVSALVLPFVECPEGEEDTVKPPPLAVYRGTFSYEGVLFRLGFIPFIPAN